MKRLLKILQFVGPQGERGEFLVRGRRKERDAVLRDDRKVANRYVNWLVIQVAVDVAVAKIISRAIGLKGPRIRASAATWKRFTCATGRNVVAEQVRRDPIQKDLAQAIVVATGIGDRCRRNADRSRPLRDEAFFRNINESSPKRFGKEFYLPGMALNEEGYIIDPFMVMRQDRLQEKSVYVLRID